MLSAAPAAALLSRLETTTAGRTDPPAACRRSRSWRRAGRRAGSRCRCRRRPGSPPGNAGRRRWCRGFLSIGVTSEVSPAGGDAAPKRDCAARRRSEERLRTPPPWPLLSAASSLWKTPRAVALQARAPMEANTGVLGDRQGGARKAKRGRAQSQPGCACRPWPRTLCPEEPASR